MCPACLTAATELVVAGATLTAGGAAGLVSVVVTALRLNVGAKPAEPATKT